MDGEHGRARIDRDARFCIDLPFERALPALLNMGPRDAAESVPMAAQPPADATERGAP